MAAQIDPVVLFSMMLATCAILGAAVVQQRRAYDERRQHADQLLHLLHDYDDWFAAQRLAGVSRIDVGCAVQPLTEAARLRAQWFPERGREMADLLLAHSRLLEFLAVQQALWRRDPEAWAASDHDRRYMALWRQHRDALQALGDLR